MPGPHTRFMNTALRLAQKAEGRTAPNPPVGAVVVIGDRVVGQGWHKYAGAPHAEPMALDQAGDLAKGADLYVTLEPCNHQGRTPPCSERVIKAGIRRVFIGSLDPNPTVSGGGATRLAEAGIEVISGVLKDRCDNILRPFAKHVTTGRPWVTIKLAASLDGRIAVRPGRQDWLTGPEAARFVHRLRNRCEAILVGRKTVEVDDPSLTARLPRGQGQNPLRVILDSKLRINPKAKVIRGPRDGGPAGGGAVIFSAGAVEETARFALEQAGVETATATGPNGRVDLGLVLDDLGRRGVIRLLVEGGPETAGAFLRSGLADELILLYAPLVIGGRTAPGMVGGPDLDSLAGAVGLDDLKTARLGKDLMVAGLVRKA